MTTGLLRRRGTIRHWFDHHRSRIDIELGETKVTVLIVGDDVLVKTGEQPPVALEGVVRHDLNPIRSVKAYDYTLMDPAVQTENTLTNTLKALAQLEENRQTALSVVENVNLSDDQVNDVLSFLESLTDPCVKDVACLAPWLPSGADPDGLQLEAVDRQGRALAPLIP